MGFTGFPEAGLAFLKDLASHNDKVWYEAHRKPWDDLVVPAMLDWLAELKARLADTMPGLVLQARVGGSLYRPARDTRFGKDKRPYNTYTAGTMWDGADRADAPALYLRVAPDEVLFSGGLFVFEEARLDRYRKQLQQLEAAERLEGTLKAARKAGLELEGEQLPRPPRPFHGEHPRGELARYKGLTLARREKPGPWLFTREALDRSDAFARAYAPLHAWMREELFS